MLINVNGNQLFCEVLGTGEPMLLIHGLGGSQNFWWSIACAFSDNYKVIIPDLPCAARSSNDPGLSISSLAHDMLALMDELDINSAHVVGHSMGTIVCQHMATMAPERILDLVLLGPLAQPPEPARGALKDRAEAARKDGMAPIATAVSNAALSNETKNNNANIQGFVREMLLGQSPEGYALSCSALSEATQANPKLIDCPCLLITGDEDAVAPPSNVEVLSMDISNTEMHVLEHCGHWTPNEKPLEVNALMKQFYSK